MPDMNIKEFNDAVPGAFGLDGRHGSDDAKPALRFGPEFNHDGCAFDANTWERHATRQEETSDLTRLVITYPSPDQRLELRIWEMRRAR